MTGDVPPGLPLTGERTLPGIPEENYWFRRHLRAYRLAGRLARGRVVDAGSGEGYGAELLARRARVVGLELDAAAAAHAARAYPRARFAVADLCRMPLAPGSAQAVVALQVIEHLWCPDEFLSDCRRVLVPDGVLVVSTPNRATFPAGLNPTHAREYEAEELRAILRRHFRDVRLLGTAHGPALRLLDRLSGGSVQHRLVARSYREQPWWLRAALRLVTARGFRITRSAASGLDLVAICRGRRSGRSPAEAAAEDRMGA